MRFTSEQRLDDGVLERGFTLGEIPGIMWTPASASASAPAPLILLGHPGGLRTMYPRLAARARHSAAEHGFASATIELPGSGDPVGYSGGVISGTTKGTTGRRLWTCSMPSAPRRRPCTPISAVTPASRSSRRTTGAGSSPGT